MLENILVLTHSSIKIKNSKTIYFDPFKIDKNYNDADYIFITHSHYDHYSEEDIKKVRKKETKIIITLDLKEKVKELGFENSNIIIVAPNEKYIIDTLNIETIPAYNNEKQFHPKSNNWVGYIIEINDEKYYIAGDTDITEENKKIKCDVALLPIGGTFTMNYEEAAELANIIKPKIVIPIHYGSIVGNKCDAEKFTKLINKEIKCEIKLK